jgi:hypothetical protein
MENSAMIPFRPATIPTLLLTVTALSLLPTPTAASEPQAPATSASAVLEGTYLYRFSMLQAAPGRLVDLIDAVRRQAPAVAAAGDELPFIVRHSQGDHWDLIVISPMGSFASFYAPDRVARRTAGTAGEQARPAGDSPRWSPGTRTCS